VTTFHPLRSFVTVLLLTSTPPELRLSFPLCFRHAVSAAGSFTSRRFFFCPANFFERPGSTRAASPTKSFAPPRRSRRRAAGECIRREGGNSSAARFPRMLPPACPVSSAPQGLLCFSDDAAGRWNSPATPFGGWGGGGGGGEGGGGGGGGGWGGGRFQVHQIVCRKSPCLPFAAPRRFPTGWNPT